MRSALCAAVVLGIGCGGAGTTQVVAVPTRIIVEGAGTPVIAGSAGSWLGGAPAQTRLLVGADGQTYIGIWIDAPTTATATVRAPMALSLVVDTSGSMDGDKIVHARMAATSMLETVQDGDLVSIYAFSNSVMEIAPPTVVGPATRAALMQAVAGLVAAGGTNMYDGIRVGEQRLAAAPGTHAIRRLVLISDGQANVGPSDPASLAQLAANGTEWGAQVTAIGVGLDYSEATLGALATSSSGRLYHLTSPAQMASILQNEVQLLAQAVAIDGVIELVPASGVSFLGVVQGGGAIEDGRLRVRVGTLHAAQQREILVRASVDTSSAGARSLGTARFVYRDPAAVTEPPREQRVDLAYEVTTDQASASGSAQPRVSGMLATHQAAEAQLRAVALLNEGRNAEAAQVFQFADEQIQGEIAAAPPSPMRERLEQQSRRLRQSASGAAAATSAPAQRSVALEANDSAYEAMGY